MLLINLSTGTHAKEFLNVINDKEECFIEGSFKDNLVTGVGVCKKTYENKISGNTEHLYTHGSYEGGEKTGLFLELLSSDNYLFVSFSEYENNMKDGYHISLLGGDDTYLIYQFVNDIEQGLMLENYPTMEAINEYIFMVDGGADFEHEITQVEIKNFETGFIVFENSITETYRISELKKYAESDERFKDLENKALGIMENFYNSMYSKYEEPKVYRQ